MAARITQQVVEVLRTGNPTGRVTQQVVEVLYDVLPKQVDDPTIIPGAGVLLSGSNIIMNCAFEFAPFTIYYTTDGTDPDETDTEYTVPFPITTDVTIKAKAFSRSNTPSSIVSQSYTIGETMPKTGVKSVVFDIIDNYGNTSYVGIRQIDFLKNGKIVEPPFIAYSTTAHASYPSKWAFQLDGAQILDGAWVNNQWLCESGSPTKQRITIVFETLVDFDEVRYNNSHSNGGSTDTGGKNVIITTTPDEVISEIGEEYLAAVPNPSVIFSGIFAVHISSNVIDNNYMFNTPAPVMSPKGGNYDVATETVVITAEDADTIYFTTDGSTPTTGSSVYTSPITITDEMVIKAFAVQAGENDSTILEHLYIDKTEITPTMTSNTAPSGVVSASSEFSGDYQAFEAFDKGYTSSDAWLGGNGILPSIAEPMWIQYEFPSPIVATHMQFLGRGGGKNNIPKVFVFLGSNNGTDWDTLYSRNDNDRIGADEWTEIFEIDLVAAYTHYRLSFTSYIENTTSLWVSIGELKIFTIVPGYTNPDGSGPRQLSISATGTFNLNGGLFPGLIDGNTGSNSGYCSGAVVAGEYFRYEFLEPVVIDEATWYQDATATHGLMKWQGSNDASDWTDIGGSFTLGGGVITTHTELNGNTTAYKYYQLVGVSGTWNTGPDFQEIEFSIGLVPKSTYIHEYGIGDRSALITITESIAFFARAYTEIIDDSTSGDLYFTARAVTDEWIKFELADPQIVSEAKFFQTMETIQGVWKWQGSYNDSDWTDIGGSFTLGGGVITTHTELNGNTFAYKYYRLFGISGTTDTSGIISDILFKIGEIIPVDTPVILPTSGAYPSTQEITITCGTAGSAIYYTEDGTDPDETDTEYTVPFALDAAKTIKAIGIKASLGDSAIASETYTIINDFRYWRVYISSGVGSSLSLGEIEMFDSVYGTNLCTGGIASASSEAFGSVAAEAFDGDPITWWHAATTVNEWIEYDFGAANEKNIIQISIICRDAQPTQAPKTFVVQASVDGISWYDIWNETDITTWTNKLPFLFFKETYTGAPISWRVNTSAIDGGSEFALAEMELRATPGGTDLSIGGSAFASVYNATYTPSNAFDKNASTFYTGSSVPAWLLYMLPSSAYIQELVLQARPSVPNQSPKDFIVESSVDNINWSVIDTFTGETGWTNGEIRLFAINTVTAPVILPTSGAYPSTQEITITCGTAGSAIYYTEDGTDPDETDTEYTVPFALDAAKTIKAIGIKAGLNDSEITSETYTISSGAQQPRLFIIT